MAAWAADRPRGCGRRRLRENRGAHRWLADGASGWGRLVGPTSGYLLAFAISAAGIGYASDTGRLRRFWATVGAMVGTQALIPALGWARLAATLGAGLAFDQGVAPFLVGGMVKSMIAASLTLDPWHSAGRRLKLRGSGRAISLRG